MNFLHRKGPLQHCYTHCHFSSCSHSYDCMKQKLIKPCILQTQYHCEIFHPRKTDLIQKNMLENEPYFALNSNMNHSAHGRGVPGPGPGSQTRVFKQLDPPDPGPLRPGFLESLVLTSVYWHSSKTVLGGIKQNNVQS